MFDNPSTSTKKKLKNSDRFTLNLFGRRENDRNRTRCSRRRKQNNGSPQNEVPGVSNKLISTPGVASLGASISTGTVPGVSTFCPTETLKNWFSSCRVSQSGTYTTVKSQRRIFERFWRPRRLYNTIKYFSIDGRLEFNWT